MEPNHLIATLYVKVADFIYPMIYHMDENKKTKRSEDAKPW